MAHERKSLPTTKIFTNYKTAIMTKFCDFSFRGKTSGQFYM